MRWANLVVAIGPDQQQVARVTPTTQILNESKSRGGDPLQIVEKKHQWGLRLGKHVKKRAKYHLKAVARVLRWQVRNRRLCANHQLQFRNQTREEPAVWLDGLPDGVAPASEFHFVAAEDHLHERLQGLGERGIRDIARQLIAFPRSENAAREAQRLVELVDDG